MTTMAGWAEKSFKNYMIGFISCLLLTGISFYLVQAMSLDKTIIYASIAVFAIVQLLVQVFCFLGFSTSSEGRLNTLPFLFTLLIIFFLIGGSLWIMHNLNVLMMDSYM